MAQRIHHQPLSQVKSTCQPDDGWAIASKNAMARTRGTSFLKNFCKSLFRFEIFAAFPVRCSRFVKKHGDRLAVTIKNEQGILTKMDKYADYLLYINMHVLLFNTTVGNYHRILRNCDVLMDAASFLWHNAS